MKKEKMKKKKILAFVLAVTTMLSALPVYASPVTYETSEQVIDIAELAIGRDAKDSITVGQKKAVSRDKLDLNGYDYSPDNDTSRYNVEFSIDAADSVYFQAGNVPAGASFEFTESFTIVNDDTYNARLYFKRNTNRGVFRVELVSQDADRKVYPIGTIDERGSNSMDTRVVAEKTKIPGGTYRVRFVCETAGTLTAAKLILSSLTQDQEEDKELAYGEREGMIVINAADAIQNTKYASHVDKTAAHAGKTDADFAWKITENPKGDQEGWEGHQGIQLTPVRDGNTGSSWMWEKEEVSKAPSLSYQVYVKEAGEYYFSYYSSCPNISADSFHVGVNGEYQFKSSDQMTGGSDANHAAAGAAWYFCDKTTVKLNKGINTIQIWARESGIRLRQIMLAKEKPMDARYLYFNSQKNTEWLGGSTLVTGHIMMSDLSDLSIAYGGKETVLLDGIASNDSAVTYQVASSTDHVLVSDVTDGAFTIEAKSSGYSTITVTAEAEDCTKEEKHFFVNVGYKYSGEVKKEAPQNLIVAPATETKDSIAVVWDKPDDYKDITGYYVLMDGQKKETRPADKTHYTAVGLLPDTEYTFQIEAVYKDGKTAASQILTARTDRAGEVSDIRAYGASVTGTVKENTKAIQKAIDECPEGGTVLIPEGTFLTGALDLKSHMTLQVEGELKGSEDPEDYLYPDVPWDDDETGERIMTRYEGWEVLCHRSLINIGHLNWQDRYEVTCENVDITGKGKITGGGTKLRDATVQYAKDHDWRVGTANIYERTRGRLMSVVQSKNVNMADVTLSEPPCWTTHLIYSDTVTTHGMTIISKVLNGDGWDPDSSRNCMLFDTKIETGDDCVAIKSGKNPEGDRVGMPTENVKIFDINCVGGHGLAMGSEISGGIDQITIRDCVVQNTWYGLQLKGTPQRGGYITNLNVQDCTLNMLLVKSNVGYNADGAAAADVPYFQNLTFKNLKIDGKDAGGGALTSAGAVEVAGYNKNCSNKEHNHFVNNVVFEDVVLGTADNQNTNKIILENCDQFQFKNVTQYDGSLPQYDLRQVNKEILVDGLNIAGENVLHTDIKIGDTVYRAPGPVTLPVSATVAQARSMIGPAAKTVEQTYRFYKTKSDADQQVNELGNSDLLKNGSYLSVTVAGNNMKALYLIKSGTSVDIAELAIGKTQKDSMIVGDKKAVSRDKLILVNYDYAAENAIVPYNVEFSIDAPDSVYFQAEQVPVGASFEFTEPFTIAEDGNYIGELYYKRNSNRGVFKVELVSDNASKRIYPIGRIDQKGNNNMDTKVLGEAVNVPAGSYRVRFVCEAAGNLTAARLFLGFVSPGEEETVDKTALDQAIKEAVLENQKDRYTTDSWDIYSKALKAAKEVQSDKEATQKEVDDVAKALADAQNTLKEKEPDKTPVQDIFHDIEAENWFTEYVQFVFDNEIMTGLDEVTFGPDVVLSRAHFATIMYRMEGKPQITYEDRFPDVPDEMFYTDAVMWASSENVGVIFGYTDQTFGPGDDITREQMAVMMYRYAKYKGYDVTAASDLKDFDDRETVSKFAETEMKWAVGAGLIKGDNEKLNPQGTTSRAVCATIIKRFVEAYQ